MVAPVVIAQEHSRTDGERSRPLSVFLFGAGPTGALLALGLARLGCRVRLQDPQSLHDLASRSRAYAITHSSRRLLQRLGLWDALRSDLVPFRQLRLDDQAVDPFVWFRSQDLAPANRDADAIGWILDHKPLMQLLLQRLQQFDCVDLQLGGQLAAADSSSGPQADLTIAADGPRSSHRQAWGFPFWSVPYRQGCLTLKVSLRGAPADTAYECFRAEGPFAVLPLGGTTYQLVWSAPLDLCRQRAALEPAALLDLLVTVLPTGLSPDALLDQPFAVPLQLSLAPRLARGQRLLVGEAGHRCHPVGGQGLNLCWRDVAELLHQMERFQAGSGSCTSHDLARLARRYSRTRLLDLVLISAGTDLLLRLFSNRFWPLLPVRALGLTLMKRMPLLRRFALQAMSDGPMTFISAPTEWRQR
jgi:2-octaprenyl-6-methoxyphenol hydroxylase